MQFADHRTHTARAVSESLALRWVVFGHCALRFSAEEIEQGDG